MNCARIIIAGTGSGVGKTSMALALVRCLLRRGLRVQTFKVGPDFLDPTYLAMASGRPCYNLDGWMCGKDYVLDLFQRKAGDADIAVIEGVMGLFDGASPENLEGSTAEIAGWLEAPVLLVTDAHGVSRSLAATVKGFTTFEPDLRFAGIIANNCGSDRQAAWLAASLAAASLPPLIGAIPRRAFPILPSRHLGLVTANRQSLSGTTLEALANVLERHVKVEEIIRLATQAPAPRLPDGAQASEPVESGRYRGDFIASPLGEVAPAKAGAGEGLKPGDRPLTLPSPQGEGKTLSASDGRFPSTPITIAIARDDAFHFYYPDNLEALQSQGARLAFFSPLADRQLPDSTDAVYLGGGYPEEYAAALGRNLGLLEELRGFAERGGAVYAECGGLMYLSQGIETRALERYPLAGVLPFWTRMSARRQALGYIEATLKQASFLGQPGQVLRGHEFHYSEIMNPLPLSDGWQAAYELRYRRETVDRLEGFQRGRVLASYAHLHFASRPGAAQAFVKFVRSSPRTPQRVINRRVDQKEVIA